MNFFVKKVSDQTLDTLGKMEEKFGLLTVWYKYKKELDDDKKINILFQYLQENGITITKNECQSLTLPDIISLLKNPDN